MKLWQKDNNHTGLHFKRLVEIKRFKAFSIRITGAKAAGYRMIGRETAPGVISWFWLGDHEAYEREIARLR